MDAKLKYELRVKNDIYDIERQLESNKEKVKELQEIIKALELDLEEHKRFLKQILERE